jgi:hypothetical protein
MLCTVLNAIVNGLRDHVPSRVPTELVFDVGVGDIFSVRVAGNVIGTKSMGSLEYAVGVSGVKLVIVLGHTRCGAVTSSVRLIATGQDARSATGCQHLQAIVDERRAFIDVGCVPCDFACFACFAVTPRIPAISHSLIRFVL